jgi:hypothetical protein
LRTEISTEEDISALEARTGLRFPEGYADFCQIFGKGYFGDDWIHFDVPKRENIESYLRSNSEIVDAYSIGIVDNPNFEDIQKQELISLLERSWIFGFGNQVLFLFSQEVYGELNLTCKIYAFDYDLNLYDLGRDFFAFLEEVCLGERIKEDFPELLESMLPLDKTIDQIKTRTFTPSFPMS